MQPLKQDQFVEQNETVRAPASLKIHLFGAPSFFINGNPLSETTSQKVEALFAYLVCHPHPHLREALASLLFNAQSRSQANNNLRVLLSRLRRVCEDTILINRQTVRLNPVYTVWLDTAVFQKTRLQKPEHALRLYRGDFLETVQIQEAKSFEEWAAMTREQYRLMALESLLQLVEKYEARGKLQEAIPFVRQISVIEPYHEGWQRKLIRLYLATGQRQKATEQFEACCRNLHDIFGQQPSLKTMALLNGPGD